MSRRRDDELQTELLTDECFLSALIPFVLTGEDMALEGRRQLALFLVRNESVHLLSLSHLLPLQEGFFFSFAVPFFFVSNKLPPLYFIIIIII